MTNATARKYFLHNCDRNAEGKIVCYFAQRNYDENGWGLWIDASGNVDIDSISASGESPSSTVIKKLKTAAVKYLASK